VTHARAPNASHRVLPDLALDLAFVDRRDVGERLTEAILLVGGPSTRAEIGTFRLGRSVVIPWSVVVRPFAPVLRVGHRYA
jgi:hypothetical protein